MKNTSQRKKLKIEITIVIIISLITGIMAYLNQYYHAEGVEDALESDVEVTVTKTEDGYFFDGKGTESAMVFYPGAKVEEISYAPLMKQLAANGLDCYLVTMPGNLAIFGMNKATDVMTAYKYKHWYIGGHSLGGAMAASYAADHADELDGLLLLAAYSTKDLSDSDLAVVSLVGSEDGVIKRDKLAKYADNLPKDTTVDIQFAGGNHAYYGNYGEQDGDGKAGISREEEQATVVDAVVEAWL